VFSLLIVLFLDLSVKKNGSVKNCSTLGASLGCHLPYPRMLQANTVFNISLKRYFQNVSEPQTRLLWVRHWVLQVTFFFYRVPQA